MAHDQTFRLILVMGFIVVFPIAAHYRLKAHKSKEKLDRRQEGLFILMTLRPVALMCMIGLVLYVVNPVLMSWSSVPLPSWLRWLGVAIGVCGGFLLIWTMRTLGPNLTDTVVTRQNHSLVTSGPYRWVRHPFYLAAALAMTANSLVTANWFLFLTGAASVALLMIRTRKEEQNLINRFGDEYREYMAQTGQFFPVISQKHV